MTPARRLPRSAFPALRPAPVVDLHPTADTDWTALRPADGAPCVVCWYSEPGRPTVTHLLRRVVDRPETRDAAWWRERLGRGVAFTLYQHDRGTDHRGRRLGMFGMQDDPPPRLDDMPERVTVRTPDGDVRALYVGKGEDGHVFEADRYGWPAALRAGAERMGWVARQVRDFVSERRARRTEDGNPTISLRGGR